jgi:hypothetical protein
MESFYHNFLGPFIFFSLIFLIIFAFFVRKTKLTKYFKINETFFIITNLCGILCGISGIIVIFILPLEIVKGYLWKILIIPYVYLQIYIAYIMIIKKTTQIYDEKQNYDMITGAAWTMAGMVILMVFIAIPLIKDNILSINLLMPFYLNAMILIYSGITLFCFKRV